MIIPDYVNVVAVTPDQKFICFRQVKYAVEGTTLAIVGGFIDQVKRLLMLPSVNSEKRLDIWLSDGYPWVNSAWMPIVAREREIFSLHWMLSRSGNQIADDLEEQELLLMRKDDIRSELMAGEFKVLSWSAILAMALIHLDMKWK